MLSKDKSWDILEHGTFDISKIKDQVLKISQLADFNNNDRNMKYKVHRDTISKVLFDFPLTWAGENIESEIITDDLEVVELILPIIKELESFFDGKVGRVLLANLPAKKEIGQHRDSGYYLESVRRNHIPIINNDDVLCEVGSQSINMKSGHWYEINNNNPHYVKNNGDQDRYHLIIDILPKGVLNSGNII